MAIYPLSFLKVILVVKDNPSLVVSLFHPMNSQLLFLLSGFWSVGWIFAILLLLDFASPCSSKQMVQRLNYGVVFQAKESIVVATDFWYHTFVIDLPPKLNMIRNPKCQRDNVTCAMIGHVISQIDSIRSQTASRLNTTVQFIKELIPEGSLPKSRSRRSLLPFVGKLSRGLFGTATMEDVNVLANHINRISRITNNMAKSLVHQEQQLSSFISTANSRMENLMSGIQDNMLAIKYIQRQLHTTALNLEETFEYLMSVLTGQIQTSAQLSHQLEELKLGVSDLMNGKLSPLLIPQHVMSSTMQDIQEILNTKFHGFHVNIHNINHIYSDCQFLVARNNSKVCVTIKIPISSHQDPLNFFQVIAMPVPLNSSSSHATQLLDLPKYFVITHDKQFYFAGSNFEFSYCRGETVKYCPFNLILKPVTSKSCILAIFGNDKSQAKAQCDFRFLENSISPKIRELESNVLLLYKTPLLSLNCLNSHNMLTGCDFCIIKVPCKCSVSTSQHYIPPRLGSCKHTDNVTTIVHPVNLAVLQHFFDDQVANNILADTLSSIPVNVTLPQFKVYKHKMSDIIAADSKQHLSLQKMAEAAKNNVQVFQSLVEPLLDGQIDIESNWPSTNDILIIVSMSASAILAVLLIHTIFKLRKLASSVLLLQQVRNIKAAVTPIPSFTYTQNDELEGEETIFSKLLLLEFTWDHIIFILLVVSVLLLLIVGWKYYKFTTTCSICLEITNGKQCVLIDILMLPICPDYCHVQVPNDITDLHVIKACLSSKLHIDWPGFAVRNTLTGDIIEIDSVVNITLLQAYHIKHILRQPFFVYIYKRHHGMMIPMQ